MKVIAIDLDDTLFGEIYYVAGGFRAVSECIANYNGTDAEDVFNQMWYQFEKYGRNGAFNRTMSYFGLNSPDVGDLVKVYREHDPVLQLYWKTEEALERLRKNFKLAIVTDGLASVQRKKVKSLGVEKMVDKVVYCMDYNAPKPSPVPYQALAKDMGVSVKDIVIVGDDPYADMKAAANLQIPSYRVLSGKYIKVKSLEDAQPVGDFGSLYMVAVALEKTNG